KVPGPTYPQAIRESEPRNSVGDRLYGLFYEYQVSCVLGTDV
ncbi:hypothetical protein A2U01_0037967, partial [Trifolium medium]|nr:hypothetical protein [Trifolium medium]